MKKFVPAIIFLLLILINSIFTGCIEEDDCEDDHSLDVIDHRDFQMGFSTWSFGPDLEDRQDTYKFISENADVYSEQIDNHIPWNSYIDNTTLPEEFTDDISYRVSKKLSNHDLILSISFLNMDRSDILDDYQGNTPEYEKLNDLIIEDAYFSHVSYLIDQFDPDYLILAMEVNELYLASLEKWEEYKLLMSSVRTRIKERFPNLLLSESVTLHNWFNPDIENREEYISEISSYVNQLDFVSVSFYPFLKGLKNKTDFQQAFDFLHDQVEKPIAFVETAHIAEPLIIPNLNVYILSNVCDQQYYLESILLNAYEQEYSFLIWWTFHDFDELWETFPEELKDIGKIWRDTGLLNENGEQRPAFTIWEKIFSIS